MKKTEKILLLLLGVLCVSLRAKADAIGPFEAAASSPVFLLVLFAIIIIVVILLNRRAR